MFDDGVEVSYGETRVILDPCKFNSRCKLALLTHAHRDHSKGFVEYDSGFATNQTLDLLSLYTGKRKTMKSGKIRIGEKLKVDCLEISVHDAGHILGSVMFYISTPENTILYTGDLNCVETLISKPAEEVPCEILIIDSTFGYPYFRFPSRDKIYSDIINWVVDAVKCGYVPVLHADSIGNSQELITLLNKFTKIPVITHPRISEVNEIYKQYGFKLNCLNHKSEEGFEAIKSGFCVYIAPKNVNVSLGKPIVEALVSGWALSFGGFPLSDHADYPSLINYIAAVKPKVVYTYPKGYSSRVFASKVEKILNIPARSIGDVSSAL